MTLSQERDHLQLADVVSSLREHDCLLHLLLARQQSLEGHKAFIDPVTALLLGLDVALAGSTQRAQASRLISLSKAWVQLKVWGLAAGVCRVGLLVVGPA